MDDYLNKNKKERREPKTQKKETEKIFFKGTDNNIIGSFKFELMSLITLVSINCRGGRKVCFLPRMSHNLSRCRRGQKRR